MREIRKNHTTPEAPLTSASEQSLKSLNSKYFQTAGGIISAHHQQQIDVNTIISNTNHLVQSSKNPSNPPDIRDWIHQDETLDFSHQNVSRVLSTGNRGDHKGETFEGGNFDDAVDLPEWANDSKHKPSN